MLRTLSGRLSATFNLDGNHLDLYLERRGDVVSSLCQDLILHDQILIPTSDYLTAAGLIISLGEHNVTPLLEQNKIRFLRTRGVFTYVRGMDRSGRVVVLNDPDARRPQDSSIDESVNAGLSVIADQITERRLLTKLLIEQSEALEFSQIIDETFRDAQADLKATSLWKVGYNYPHKDLVALPKIDKMSGRVLGPGTDIEKNPIDLLLALSLFNAELYLATQWDCVSSSTASPLGDSIDLKVERLAMQQHSEESFWRVLAMEKIPDFSQFDPIAEKGFDQLIKLTNSTNAGEFRKWFHERKQLSGNELAAEYVELLRTVPLIQKLPAKIIRFAITLPIEFIPIPGLSSAISFLDTFVIEKLMKGNSPRYFIDDLKKFRGVVRSK